MRVCRLPLHGAKELCASDDGAHNYRVLVQNSDFRKVLSNFYAPEKPIEYKGHLFATLVGCWSIHRFVLLHIGAYVALQQI